MTLKPPARPKLTEADVLNRLALLPLTPGKGQDKLLLVGIRGYYRDTMGKPGINDRGIYDDAICILVPGVHFSAWNANTDPSRVREGSGTGRGKGMAVLKPGLWRAHRFGLHKGQYRALVQTGGKVTVIRDGRPPCEDTGFFGINIHRGGINTTSSEGCQTIPPDQWPSFIATVDDLAKRLGRSEAVLPYILLTA